MTRLETLNLLIDISESIEYFERKIQTDSWSNQFGAGLEWKHINHKNTNDIHTYKKCIDRLNERFNKYKNTL
tara:strand:- start:4 stop:219 length:216 start_codon:yes stop_codon:yes gene_type:complete